MIKCLTSPLGRAGFILKAKAGVWTCCPLGYKTIVPNNSRPRPQGEVQTKGIKCHSKKEIY